ncbi:MAG: two-component regulator propeller domain-containing protein [Bacteroidia bacterium]
MIRLYCLLSLFVFSCICANAQRTGNGVLGEWREHLPFTSGLAVASTSEKVYCATNNGVVILRKDDNSLERLSRSNGLTDINLTCLNYHNGTNTLMIGYRNGNLDLVNGNTVTNVSDIKRSTVVQGGKTIQAIRFIDDEAYICTNFGIVVFDMVKREVRNTLYPSLLNPEIFDVTEHEGRVYASTSKGLFSADLQSPQLPFFVAWTRDTLIGERPVNSAAFFEGNWIVARYKVLEEETDTLFRERDGALEIMHIGDAVQSLTTNGSRLIISNAYNMIAYEEGVSEFRGLTSYEPSGVSPRPAEVSIDPDDPNILWIADQGVGLARSESVYAIDIYTAEGPPTANVFDMEHSEGVLWVAAGSYNIEYSPTYSIEGVFRFEDGFWDAYQFPTIADYIRDIVGIAIDPADKEHLYVASFGNGLAELREGALVDTFNSTDGDLVGLTEYPRDIRLSDVALDKDGRLWVGSTASQFPLQMRDADGEWHHYSFNSSINQAALGRLTIDSTGQKWMIVHDRGLLIVKTDENDVEGFRLLTDQVGNGGLPSNIVFSVAEDQEGQIWVGTSKGVAVFYSPEAILEQGTSINWDAQQIIISQGGFNQYLLEAEEVTAIYIDGANRKWLGTRNAGLFLVSPNGEEQLQHFTSEDTPLLSNTILSLSMNEETGELYIGTDLGICSYRTDATRGEGNFDNVYAFPNPVERGYNGPIAITGLVRDADVKITDVSGNLVFRTRSNGGTAIWNGNRYSGERAATGVYLVFCTNDDGSQTAVTKIMLIN